VRQHLRPHFATSLRPRGRSRCSLHDQVPRRA
jgi:hypothetical protein